jgi:hypothetical protein
MKSLSKHQGAPSPGSTLNYSRFLPLLIMLLFSQALASQDTLMLKSNDTLLIYVEKATDEEIRYQKDLDSDTYFLMPLHKVKSLRYADGRIQKGADDVVEVKTADTLILPLQQKVIVRMIDGEEFIGEVLSQDITTISLKTANGEMNLKASNVESVEPYDYEGPFRFVNPNATRYFFGPSAIPLKKGEGYYQNIWVTTNFVNYGVADNVSIGGGFEFISTILGTPVWFLTPKVGFQLSEKNYLGGGFIMAGAAEAGTATLLYGVYTRGTTESSFTLGAGYGLFDGEFSNYPTIMFAGMHRLSNAIILLSENYVITTGFETTYFGIHGIRILGRKDAFDLGIIFIPLIAAEVPGIPYVGYVRTF